MAKPLQQLLNLRHGKTKAVIYALLILIPGYFSSFYLYQRTVAELHEQLYSFLLDTLSQSVTSISFRLQAIEEMTNLVVNPNLREYISGNPRTDMTEPLSLQLVHYNALNDIFNLQDQKNSDIYKLRLFVDRSYIFSRERVRFFSMDQLTNEPWYKEWMDKRRDLLWKSTYLDDLSLESPAPYLFSVARLVHSKYNLDQVAGVLFIDILEEKIYEMIRSVSDNSNGSVYILDQQGATVSAGDKSLIGTKLFTADQWETLHAQPEGTATLPFEGHDMIIAHKVMPFAGWTLISITPKKMLQKSVSLYQTAFRFSTMIFAAIILLLSISILYAFTIERIVRRIRRMNQSMKLNNLDSVRIFTKPKQSVIGKLEYSIERMIHTIRELTEESYEAKLREKEAQLTVLQAQINPHFLYNTLDMIKWMAIRNQMDKFSDTIDALATYFRMCLNKGEDIVTLHDELKLIQVYLNIQRLRTDRQIHFELIMDESLQYYTIPKLTIQPIIENALYHGILESPREEGLLQVKVMDAGHEILIQISDNGIGMDADKVDQIMKYAVREGSYGLFNVNERLRLYFGEHCGIGMASTPGEGTLVTLRILKKAKSPS